MAKEIIGFLTSLSVYRLLKNKAPVDLSTVTNEFTGVSRSFDLETLNKAIKSLKIEPGSIHKSKMIDSEAAGPINERSI
jgi:hypothetical protein